jgi:hypothetical protein
MRDHRLSPKTCPRVEPVVCLVAGRDVPLRLAASLFSKNLSFWRCAYYASEEHRETDGDEGRRSDLAFAHLSGIRRKLESGEAGRFMEKGSVVHA